MNEQLDVRTVELPHFCPYATDILNGLIDYQAGASRRQRIGGVVCETLKSLGFDMEHPEQVVADLTEYMTGCPGAISAKAEDDEGGYEAIICRSPATQQQADDLELVRVIRMPNKK
jgi:hypothetical protein